MLIETYLQMIWRILEKMLIIDLLIFAIAGVIWFFSGGARSADRYASSCKSSAAAPLFSAL